MPMKKITIAIPCYNESANIAAVYEAVRAEIDKLDRYEWEIIFEDNCSTDDTVAQLRALAEKDKRVRAIVNMANYGVERSGSNLLLAPCADAIITLAADLEDPPALIPQFVAAWEEGWPVVLGQYTARAGSAAMGLCRRLYYRIMDAFSEVKLPRNVTGFGLYDMAVMDEVRKLGEYTIVSRFIVVELGYPVKCIPYEKPQRTGGKSSYSLLKYYRVAVDSLVLTSHAPLHLAGFIGFVLSICSLLVALYYFIQKLLHWYTFELGLAPLIIGIFFLGGVQLFFIGVLGEYLSSAIKRLQKRPFVIEKERINFEGYGAPGKPERTAEEDAAEGEQ